MALNEFCDYLKNERRYSVHTVSAYKHDLTSFQAFLKTNYNLSNWKEVNHQLIRSWLILLLDSLDERSVNRKLSSLKSFYRFLLGQGLVEENPCKKVVAPKSQKKLVRVIPEEDLQKLFSDIEFPDNYWGHSASLILDLFYQTGIRQSELINLELKNIDLNNSNIKVLGKRNKERVIPILENLRVRLVGYLDIRQKEFPDTSEKYLFLTQKGNKLYSSLVYKTVNSYLSKVSGVSKKSPHILRHSFATHMLNRGAELNTVKELLGHSSLAATQVYTHNSIDKLKLMYNQAHPRGDKKS